MKKKMTRAEKMNATAAAIAFYLVNREGSSVTTEQCLKELLERTRELSNNAELTMMQMKESLQLWVGNGWAFIKKDVLHITREGQAHVQKLAESAINLAATC